MESKETTMPVYYPESVTVGNRNDCSCGYDKFEDLPTVADIIAALQEMPQDAPCGSWHSYFRPTRWVSRQSTEMEFSIENEDGSETYETRKFEVVLI